MDVLSLVKKLSKNYTEIISVEEIKRYPKLDWGNNGVGSRFANKKFNYMVLYKSKKFKIYSENGDNEAPPEDKIEKFQDTSEKRSGIIGIYIFSERKEENVRPIRSDIKNKVILGNCVVCGTNSEIICDHKNDLYNDPRVLNLRTQKEDDFQALCNHCNLQKRQVARTEISNMKVFSCKSIPRFRIYDHNFPFEKKAFNTEDPTTKIDTYWYDPIEFERKVMMYNTIILPIVKELKRIKYKQELKKCLSKLKILMV